MDERHQRALTRYYADAGAGGIAVGVHTTQFAIRDHGLYRPVLELAQESATSWIGGTRHFVLVAGVVGRTPQALAEAELAASLGYDAGLLGLGAWRDSDEETILAHCRIVAEALPLIGFYLQPAVGGRTLSYRFWREFAEIERVVAVKIAPFDRYRTLDVVRAFVDARREDVALYTGNDDAIVADLLTPFEGADATRSRWIVGGLLGQWAVWTHRAVQLLDSVKAVRASLGEDGEGPIDARWLREGAALTEANGAIFDASNAFAGCIPGIHEILRRQGLLRGIWCLDPDERLSAGQSETLDRVMRRFAWLTDDDFVRDGLARWLG